MEQFEKLLEKHGSAILMFSSGKDSAACLELLRPWLSRITLVWVDPGACHKLTLDYMEKVAKSVPNFHVIKGNQPETVAQFGWPADTLPVRSTWAGSVGAGTRAVSFQPYTDCCARSMWNPLNNFLSGFQNPLVVTGQRREELLRNRFRDEEIQTIAGITYFQPINSWTSEQVWQYLKESGADLPPFYDVGAESSADCWNCTAYLDHNLGRLKWMKKVEPAQYAEVEGVLKELQLQLKEDSAPLNELIGE